MATTRHAARMDNYQIDGPRGSITIETGTGDATHSRVVPVTQAFIQEMRLAESVPAFLRQRGMLRSHERVLTWGPISERWKPTLDRCARARPGRSTGRCIYADGHAGDHMYDTGPFNETSPSPGDEQVQERCGLLSHGPDGSLKRCSLPVGHEGNHSWPHPPPVTAEGAQQRADFVDARQENLAGVMGTLEKEHNALVKRVDGIEWNAGSRIALSGIEKRLDVLEHAHAATATLGEADALRTIAGRLRRETTAPRVGWDPVIAILKVADRLDGRSGSGLRADISSPGFAE